MKKVISSVLIFSLVLTIFVSALPVNQNNSVKISDEQMTRFVGGECGVTTAAILIIGAAWIAGAGVAIASGGTASGAVVVGVYALSASLIATGVGCGGSGGDKSSDMRTQYKFQRVN